MKINKNRRIEKGGEKLNEGMKQIFKIDNVRSQLKVMDTI